MPSDPYIGTIFMAGFNFNPRGYLPCDGRLLNIAQNAALFALLGTTYGGNGQTTFALPDLRGRAPIHQGQGPGLSNFVQGEQVGTETVALLSPQIPQHVHSVPGHSNNASNLPATQTDPAGHAFALPTDGSNAYASAGAATLGGGQTSGSTGSNTPHNNLQPLLCVNFYIAVEGIFPSRN